MKTANVIEISLSDTPFHSQAYFQVKLNLCQWSVIPCVGSVSIEKAHQT